MDIQFRKIKHFQCGRHFPINRFKWMGIYWITEDSLVPSGDRKQLVWRQDWKGNTKPINIYSGSKQTPSEIPQWIQRFQWNLKECQTLLAKESVSKAWGRERWYRKGTDQTEHCQLNQSAHWKLSPAHSQR